MALAAIGFSAGLALGGIATTVADVNRAVGPTATSLHFLTHHSYHVDAPVAKLLHKWGLLSGGGDLDRWIVKKTDTETYTVMGLACRDCGYVMCADKDFIHDTTNTPYRDATFHKGLKPWIDDARLEQMEERRSFNKLSGSWVSLDDTIRRIESDTVDFAE